VYVFDYMYPAPLCKASDILVAPSVCVCVFVCAKADRQPMTLSCRGCRLGRGNSVRGAGLTIVCQMFGWENYLWEMSGFGVLGDCPRGIIIIIIFV